MKHFLNTLALTFISFSGRFVFALQKHYLFFFASDPLVLINILLICQLFGKKKFFYLFIYLGFNVTFNTVQVISRWVVGRAEETST